MEGPRVVILIVLILFILLTPDPQVSRQLQSNPVSLRRDDLHNSLDVLRNSSYGDFVARDGGWLNLTGFRRDDGYQWTLLPFAQSFARKLFVNVLEPDKSHEHTLPEYKEVTGRRLSVYQNVTGEVRGKFSRVKLDNVGQHTVHPINLTSLVPDNDYVLTEFTRNVTEEEGEISLDLRESTDRSPRTARRIKAELAIATASSPGRGWKISLSGTHLFESGRALLTTESEKYDAGFALPHLALTKEDYNVAQDLSNETLTRWVDETTKRASKRPRFTESEAFASPKCEYVLWLQQIPVPMPPLNPNQTVLRLEQIESELMNPMGAPIGQPPVMQFSAVIFSPDCGFVLTSKGFLVGPKAEVYSGLARSLLMAFFIVLGVQAALLKRQMQEAATPSTKSRVAYHTFVIMALGDGQIAMGLLALVMTDDYLWLLASAAAFACSLNVSFLETKFIHEIWTVQVGDPAQRERDRESANGPPPAPAHPPTSADGTIGLPLPVTTRRAIDTGATPIILPPDQDIDAAQAEDEQAAAPANTPASAAAAFGSVYSQFYFLSVGLIFLSLWAMSWAKSLRSAYASMLVMIYLSFWIPQIYRNTMRNCRKALKWEYVIGISILRLLPIAYWYFEPRNILHVDANPGIGRILVGWVVLQVVVLASQQFLGPRLLVPDDWCPAAYDYHPLLHDSGDEESGPMLPTGFVASASEAKDRSDGKGGNRRTFDCAICMYEIDVPVFSKGEVNSIGASWSYMVTPCRHIFHSECLEGWMNLRLVCPICRESLPPM